MIVLSLKMCMCLSGGLGDYRYKTNLTRDTQLALHHSLQSG